MDVKVIESFAAISSLLLLHPYVACIPDTIIVKEEHSSGIDITWRERHFEQEYV